MPLLRILLIDDHPLFRAGMRMVLLDGIADVDILEAGTLEQAVHICMEPPTLVLLDIQLRGVNGLEGLGLLKSRWPDVPVIMLSAMHDADTVALATARGAAAFVPKSETLEMILQVIRQTMAGTLPVNGPSGSATVSKPRLTPRQCEILDLLSEGLSNKVIARRLGLSEFTVRGHVQAVLGLLGVSSRAQATTEARRCGLIG